MTIVFKTIFLTQKFYAKVHTSLTNTIVFLTYQLFKNNLFIEDL